MNREQARSLLAKVVEEYRRKSHADLAALVGSPINTHLDAGDGTEYQVEIDVVWDRVGDEGGDVRVLASIDDGRVLSSILPLTMAFIKAPDDTFVGE